MQAKRHGHSGELVLVIQRLSVSVRIVCSLRQSCTSGANWTNRNSFNIGCRQSSIMHRGTTRTTRVTRVTRVTGRTTGSNRSTARPAAPMGRARSTWLSPTLWGPRIRKICNPVHLMAEQRVHRGYVVSFVALLAVGDHPFNHPRSD